MTNQIGLAIVGCGNMANAHAHNLKAVPDATVVALCDINRANLESFWQKHYQADKSIRLYDTFEELCQDPPAQLRAVDIITPHTCHFPQAMAALDHGWDVLLEKPMVTHLPHALALAKKVEQTGRHFQIAFQAPFTQEFAYIRQVLDAGGLGELQTINAHSFQEWTTLSRGTWRHEPSLSGGGQMYDTGAHLFNAITWLIGRPVKEVFCWADNKDTPVDVNAVMTMRWGSAHPGGSDLLGSVTISGNTPGWQEGIWLAGDKGRIHTGIHGGWVEHIDHKGNKIKYPPVTQLGYNPIQNFILCLQGKAEPRSPARFGILHSWLMDALYASVRERKTITLGSPPI